MIEERVTSGGYNVGRQWGLCSCSGDCASMKDSPTTISIQTTNRATEGLREGDQRFIHWEVGDNLMAGQEPMRLYCELPI